MLNLGRRLNGGMSRRSLQRRMGGGLVELKLKSFGPDLKVVPSPLAYARYVKPPTVVQILQKNLPDHLEGLDVILA